MKPRLSFAVDEDDEVDSVASIPLSKSLPSAVSVRHLASQIKTKKTGLPKDKFDFREYIDDNEEPKNQPPSKLESEILGDPDVPKKTVLNDEDVDMSLSQEEDREWEAAQLRKGMASTASSRSVSTDERKLMSRLKTLGDLKLVDAPEPESILHGLQKERDKLILNREILMQELSVCEAIDLVSLETDIARLREEIERIEHQE